MLLKTILLILLFAYLIGAGLLYIFQRNLLYFPSPEYQHDLEIIELTNDAALINTMVLNPNQSRAIIYFGGNAEPVIFNQDPFSKNFPAHTIYLMNYRGFGGSTGSPTEQGLFSDALALYDYVQHKHDSISAFGRSLGSGVATYLASQRNIDALALVTPYYSIASVAQKRFPFYPVDLLLYDKFDSQSYASKVSSKTLIIMAELDSVIPNWHSIKLRDAFKIEQSKMVKISGANHNNLSTDPAYFESLKIFLPQLLKAY